MVVAWSPLLGLVVLQTTVNCVSWRDVVTTQGVVRGYLMDHSHTPYYAYKGIVYARITNNRFKAPRPARPWDGTFEATYHIKCRQADGSGTEECLVVNVFSPVHASNYPVLVVVHDGNFRSGWGSFQPPTRLLARNLVIVTFNYRLGVLGFLCLKTVEAPGNAGLKDQVAALYWIQKNIDKFGGNPFDITVYGIGSGASSVQLILLSGAGRGMFHKAILESGSALSPLSLSYEPLAAAFDAAVALGYTGTENAIELARFYWKAPIRSLVNTSTTIFLPCLENDLYETHSLLEKDPMEIFHGKNYHSVPTVFVYRNMINASETEQDISNDKLTSSFEELLPNNLRFTNENIKHRVTEIVKDLYFGQDVYQTNVVQKYMEYFNDITVEYPIIKSAVLHAATSPLPTYIMRFSLKSKTNNIFDYFFMKDLKEEDQIIVERLVTLWTNFINIGDPTPLTTSQVPLIWQPVKAVQGQFDIKSVSGLILARTLKMSSELAHNRILFWDQIYKKFNRENVVPEKIVLK